MATQVQLRRGTSLQHTSFTGAIAEVTYDTDKNTIIIHDGSTQGGHQIALKADVDQAIQKSNTYANFVPKTASISLTGDATATTTFSSNTASMAVTLASTGTSTGQFGSGSQVPIITVDAKGRITAISNTAVAGVSGFSYNAANNTFTITTADGGSYNATAGEHDTFQTIATELAHLANTNAYIAATQGNIDTLSGTVDTLTATELSHLANTNAYIAATQGNIDTLTATELAHLANTNAYIATTQGNIDTLTATELAHLANTNAYIASVNTTLLGEISTSNTAMKTYVDNQVAGIVDTAPEALNTLNELAAALGDDANFSTTILTSLGTKASNTYVNSTFQTITTELAHLANTNAYIATTQGNIDTLTATELSHLANTNAYIATTQGNIDTLSSTVSTLTATELSHLANTNAYIATKISTTDARSEFLQSGNTSVTADASTITVAMQSVDLEDRALVNPAGFLTINIGGVSYKLPYFS